MQTLEVISVNLWQILISLLNLLILFLLFKKFLFKPVNNMLAKRQSEIDEKYEAMEDFALVDELSKIANVKVPNAIEEIRTAPVLHKKECEVDEMPIVVNEFLGV